MLEGQKILRERLSTFQFNFLITFIFMRLPAIWILGLAFVLLIFNSYTNEIFNNSLQNIADRTGSDERYFYDLGVCIKENGALSFFKKCSASPKGFLISLIISFSLLFENFDSIIYVMTKFLFCWSILYLSTLRLKLKNNYFLVSCILLIFLCNVFFNHMHVQLLRDDLISAIAFAASVELYLLLNGNGKHSYFIFWTFLILFNRPEMATIFLTFGYSVFILKNISPNQLLYGTSIILFIVTFYNFYFPGIIPTHLIKFDLIKFIDGFRAAFFSPIPTNSFLDVGDMRYTPFYSFISFFISLFSFFFIIWIVLVCSLKNIRYIFCNEFLIFIVLPVAYIAAYSLIDAPVQGPRQALPATLIINSLFVAPIIMNLIKRSSRKTKEHSFVKILKSKN
jgi:hypothetical protein